MSAMSSASINGSATFPPGAASAPVEHRLQPECLAEVLVHEARADERPLGAGLAHRLLAPERSLFVPAGEQHEAADAPLGRECRERLDPLAGSGKGEVGLIRDVRRPDAVERRRPGVAVFPVERRLAGAGADPGRDAGLLEASHHAAAGLAGPAENEDVFPVGHDSFLSIRIAFRPVCSPMPGLSMTRTRGCLLDRP